MNPGTSGSMKTKDETLDHDSSLEQASLFQVIKDLPEFEHVKVEQYYPEQSSPLLQPIVKEESEVPNLTDILMTPLLTSMEMNPGILGSAGIKEVPLDYGYLVDNSLEQKTRDLFELENIKAEPHHPEQSFLPFLPIVRNETEVTKQIDAPMTMPSAYVKPEINTESIDFGIWKEESTDSGNRTLGCAAQWMTSGEQKIQCESAEVSFAKEAQSEVCQKSPKAGAELRDRLGRACRKWSHECSVCGKAFSQKCNMKQHMLIHTGEKPHKCGLCKKAFSRKYGLKQHMLIHTGDDLQERRKAHVGRNYATLMRQLVP